jgi:hypothetical protein
MLLRLHVAWISTSSLWSFGWTEQQAFGTSKAAFMGSLVEDEEEQQILLLRATQPEVWSFFCLFHQHSWVPRVSTFPFWLCNLFDSEKERDNKVSQIYQYWGSPVSQKLDLLVTVKNCWRCLASEIWWLIWLVQLWFDWNKWSGMG